MEVELLEPPLDINAPQGYQLERNEENEGLYQTLPYDILFIIFQHLSPKQILCLSELNHHWHSFINAKPVWQKILRQHFPNAIFPSPFRHPKAIFQDEMVNGLTFSSVHCTPGAEIASDGKSFEWNKTGYCTVKMDRRGKSLPNDCSYAITFQGTKQIMIALVEESWVFDKETYPGTGYIGVTKFDPSEPNNGGASTSKVSKSCCYYRVAFRDKGKRKIGVAVNRIDKLVHFYLNDERVGSESFEDFATPPMLVAHVGETDAKVIILNVHEVK